MPDGRAALHVENARLREALEQAEQHAKSLSTALEKSRSAWDDADAHRVAAERDRDRALVSAAVLLRAAREALGKYGRHFPLMCHAPNGGPCNCGLDDARKALDGEGGAQAWANRLATAIEAADDAARTGTKAYFMARADAINAALASPPTLPDPTDALAAFARSVVEACAIAVDVGISGVEWHNRGDYIDQYTMAELSMRTQEAVRALDPADLVRRWLEREGQ